MVLQRGWLFLRLYMFIFVLSEPGTWRRYILLSIASLVCLLPRNNPFTDMFRAARRHFDNLIGPPQPPARPQRPQTGEQQPGGNGTDGNRPTTSTQQTARGTGMPTPEEHARRLLREHEARNPNTIRDTIYRIEQAVALFLASLIPGVGERHVRAREEARRIVQEEEEQRRRREEEERAQEQARESEVKSESSLTPSASQQIPRVNSIATSTGVEASTSPPETTSTNSEGLRMRNGESRDQASASS